jgi:hypothetical protein
MERTPFSKNVSLRAYLNKEKDLNITKNGISLIEHSLNQKFNDPIIYYSITRLVSHPKCIIEQKKIQSLLYKNYSNFQFGAIKTDEQQSTFINRFDLNNNILIAPNNGNNPKAVDYSIGWLQIFLLDTNSFFLFDWAKKHHQEYQNGLKSVDKIGFNVWHTLVNTVSNMADNLNTYDCLHEKLNTLFKDHPEGLYHQNNFNETPYEMLEKISKKPEYSSHENLKRALHVLEYFRLQTEVEVNIQPQNKKIKI